MHQSWLTPVAACLVKRQVAVQQDCRVSKRSLRLLEKAFAVLIYCSFPFSFRVHQLQVYFEQTCRLHGSTPRTDLAGISGRFRDRRRRIGFRDRDMGCFWCEIRPPVLVIMYCQCPKTPKFLTISSTLCQTRDSRQVTKSLIIYLDFQSSIKYIIWIRPP